MIIKSLIGSLIVFAIFLALYFVSCKGKTKTIFTKICGALSLVSLILAVVFAVIYFKSSGFKLFSKVKEYDVVKVYTDTLAKKGPEKAYEYLPVNAFAQKDILCFGNSKNDIFSVSKDETGYILKTEANNTVYLASKKTLTAKINEKGELILDGYLLYSNYDDSLIEFKNKKLAENVTFCDFTANSLFYITQNGDLYGMGFNEYGQLGDSTTKNKPSPEFIQGDVIKAAVSDTHALIVDKFGTLYSVGDNSYSQLGNNNAISSNEPIKIMQGVKDVKAGNYFSLVLTVNGELYAAGNNEDGQLGNNGQNYKAKLVQVISGIDKIDINQNTCAALKHNGELYVWGDNSEFKAGCNTAEDIKAPHKLSDNVYDFALSDKGVIIINKNRDILISNESGVLETVTAFTAQVPENLTDKFSEKFNISEQKV